MLSPGTAYMTSCPSLTAAASANRANAGSDRVPVFVMIEARWFSAVRLLMLMPRSAATFSAGMAGKTHLHDLTLPRRQPGDVAGRILAPGQKLARIPRDHQTALFLYAAPNPETAITAPVPERITQMARVPHAVAIERNKKSNARSPAP